MKLIQSFRERRGLVTKKAKKKKTSRVIGTCWLCHRRRVLKRSHLLPAALYRMILRQGGRKGNPMVVTREITLQTSRQFQEHLLCGECEQRFNRDGEGYALTQVYDNHRFPLLDRLNIAMPFEQTRELSIYSGRDTGIDVDRLGYFAMSIFWRASVRRWRSARGHIHTPLGNADEELVRRYLMGEATFPNNMVLVITLCTDFESQSSVMSPALVGERVPSLGLITRGIQFRLYRGAGIPDPLRRVCSMGTERRVLLVGNCRRISVQAFVGLHANRHP